MRKSMVKGLFLTLLALNLTSAVFGSSSATEDIVILGAQDQELLSGYLSKIKQAVLEKSSDDESSTDEEDYYNDVEGRTASLAAIVNLVHEAVISGTTLKSKWSTHGHMVFGPLLGGDEVGEEHVSVFFRMGAADHLSQDDLRAIRGYAIRGKYKIFRSLLRKQHKAKMKQLGDDILAKLNSSSHSSH